MTLGSCAVARIAVQPFDLPWLGVSPMIVQRTTRDELRRVAAETFGWSQLRDEQLQAMEQVMSGHDVLVVITYWCG